MNIRKAQDKDIDRILELLSQVLELHARIRPDIFISGTTKHSREELSGILSNESTPVYVACDEADTVLGYAFCEIREPVVSQNRVSFQSLHIDDLCVDETARGNRIGQALCEHVVNRARELGCYEITLNVWDGNDAALSFYRNMGMRIKMRQMELIL